MDNAFPARGFYKALLRYYLCVENDCLIGEELGRSKPKPVVFFALHCYNKYNWFYFGGNTDLIDDS